MGDIILINGKSIEKGETAEINLQFASLPTHTMIDLPIFVYRALKDGPTLLITAGLHGDEINGIEVIRNVGELALAGDALLAFFVRRP